MGGVHMNSQPITRMSYELLGKGAETQVSVPSLVHANIISFLCSFPNNPHFNGVDVPCLTNIQSTKRYQWKTNKPLKFTLFKDPLPFGSFKFILQSKKLWRTFYKEKECSSYVGPSGEKVYVHRLWKNLVILSASPVEWFRIQIVQS